MAKRSHRRGFDRRHRVGEEIRHALAEVFARGNVHDPVLRDRPITVAEVEVGADLRHAVCHVLPFGAADAEEVLAALVRATPFLRHEVSRRVRLKYTPSLAFALDRSLDRAARIDTLLRRAEVARDVAGAGAAAPPHDDGPEADR